MIDEILTQTLPITVMVWLCAFMYGMIEAWNKKVAVWIAIFGIIFVILLIGIVLIIPPSESQVSYYPFFGGALGGMTFQIMRDAGRDFYSTKLKQ